MTYDSVTQDEGSEQPVDPVNHEIMVHLVPNMLQSEFAMIIVSVHFLGHRLVKIRVEEPKQMTACLWAQVQQENDE